MKKRYCYRILLAVFSGLALYWLGQTGAHAAEMDPGALKELVESLTHRVRALEIEVEQLQQQSAARATPAASAPAPAPSFRETWRGIHDGLTRDEVKKLLGAPQHEFMLSGKRVWYYYYAGEGGGSVFFGEDGRVAGSQAPPRPW
ncbi:MAG: hypothetical protein HY274_09990 [Gammaproteobacteria bacterium]|nr:hypothetical protein [Gammaproteobacteria bacterium]